MIYLLTMIMVGGIAGWVASLILKRNTTLLMNIGVGVAGALVGNYLFSLLGIYLTGLIGTTIAALVGAVLFLVALGFFIK